MYTFSIPLKVNSLRKTQYTNFTMKSHIHIFNTRNKNYRTYKIITTPEESHTLKKGFGGPGYKTQESIFVRLL